MPNQLGKMTYPSKVAPDCSHIEGVASALSVMPVLYVCGVDRVGLWFVNDAALEDVGIVDATADAWDLAR